jgi:hypothetical protein
MIFIAFYLVRDGGEMASTVRYYVPLRAEQGTELSTASGS